MTPDRGSLFRRPIFWTGLIVAALLLIAAQSQQCFTLAFDYRPEELTNVSFVVERSTNLCVSNWEEFVTIKVQVWGPSNSFYRVGAKRIEDGGQKTEVGKAEAKR